MTLIVSYQRDVEFVLMGDLMLSRDNNVFTPQLPSWFEGGIVEVNPALCGLSQKIVQLTDRLAVAWCGAYDVAQEIIALIKTNAASIETMDDVLDLVESSGSNLDGIHLIAYLMTVDGTTCNMAVGGFRIRQTIWEQRRKALYEGSGFDNFLRSFEITSTSTGSVNSFEETVASWLQRASIAFLKELTGHEVHDNFYGGGFELLVPSYSDHRFVKIPYSTFFWKYNETGAQRVEIAYSMQYTSEGHLIMNRFLRDEDGRPSLERFPACNLLREEPTIALPPTTADNLFCVHHFQPVNPSGRMKMLMQKGAEQDLRPRLIEEDTAVTLDISENGRMHIEHLLST